MLLNQFLLLGAVLFCIGVYGVLARRNGVIVLMSIELILNAVNINLVAFGGHEQRRSPARSSPCSSSPSPPPRSASGLAIVLLIYRNRRSIDLDEVDLMKG